MHDLGKKLKYIYSFALKRFVHVNLQILYQCNFRCSICDFWKEPYASMPMISASDARLISEKLKTIGPQIVSIGGGEPLLHPELSEIIRALAKHHFTVMICNGWYITDAQARNLFRAGLYEISISLDFANPEKHDRQRGTPGAFERAVRALEVLHNNRVHPHQRVHMISVVMDDNLDEIEHLLQLAQKMGITYLVTLYSHARGAKSLRNPQRDVSAHLLGLRKKYAHFVGLRGYLSRFTEATNNGGKVLPCYAGKNLFNIDCQGNVTRCIDRLDDVAGNILTDDITLIKGKLHKQYKTSPCGDCWTSCRGNIESLMYGPNRFMNLFDSYLVTKDVQLTQRS